jgi:hypothetical protein
LNRFYYSKCREYGAVFKFNGVKDVENKLKQLLRKADKTR